MDRNKFVRIFSRNNRIICCCDTFINSNEQNQCPYHSDCGCRSVHNSGGYHAIKEEYDNFDNTKDKILATLSECYINAECVMGCSSCNVTVARLKYLESIQ